jgi:hypothetical protein
MDHKRKAEFSPEQQAKKCFSHSSYDFDRFETYFSDGVIICNDKTNAAELIKEAQSLCFGLIYIDGDHSLSHTVVSEKNHVIFALVFLFRTSSDGISTAAVSALEKGFIGTFFNWILTSDSIELICFDYKVAKSFHSELYVISYPFFRVS